MINTYFLKKTKNLYVNINPNTFDYRKKVIDSINKVKNKYDIITKPKSFPDYLKELAQYRFCLCVRGNGLDTHRFFESLYLGVIPVILNNKHTKMDNFIYYLRKAGIPFYEITQENFTEKYIDSFFDENLYNKILENFNIHRLDSLKLNNYTI
jgi:CRISPR/Cas system-associated exonuclease Cas4 (RecB family)